MGYEDHQSDARKLVARCAVVTLSDTRTVETDTSGRAIRELLERDGHQIVESRLIPDDPARLDGLLTELLGSDEIDVILTNGGTGISARDCTIDVVEKRFDVKLPGFGELFRMLSYEQIKSGAMMSRATAGIASRKPIFCMPGSTKAVELAMTKLILPELRHVLRELRKHSGDEETARTAI